MMDTMPAELVRDAIEDARTRVPLVRAMALLCGSRVLAAVDEPAAREAFAEGLAIAETLSLARHQDFLLDEAIRIGATADPVAAVALYRRTAMRFRFHSHHTGTHLVQALAARGDYEGALALLEDPALDVGGAAIVVHSCADPALQRRAMAAARERWRSADERSHWQAAHEYHQLFSRHWRKLARADQEGWLDEMLESIRSEPDRPTSAGFGNRVELRSMRDAHLFEILGAVRALKTAEEVAAILRAHPDVEAGAKIYPLGLESLMAERAPAPEGGRRMGWIGGGYGSARDGMLEPALAALQGDATAVRRMLAEAHRLYLEDVAPEDPNLAPRTFWPSCHGYKTAMYWAGRFSGIGGRAMLAEIPDTDFAILAQIELAAGVLGLAQHSGVRSEQHRKQGLRP
jgi:hypothetical protein